MKSTNLIRMTRTLLLASAPAVILPGVLFASHPLHAEEALSLDTFLSQVKDKNDAIQGARHASAGALERSADADLVFSPTLTGDVQMVDDKKPSLFLPAIKETVNNTYSLGVSKLFKATGTQARFAYNLSYQQFVGLNNGFNIASPTLELRQPLWRGFFGTEARAGAQQLEADARARHFEASFQMKLGLADAEQTYWRLALARQAVKVQKEAVERAEKISNYNSRRAQLQLVDRSDALQAFAALESRRLDLQSAIDEERSARVAFNSARGRDGEDVPESLAAIDRDLVEKLEAPVRAELRDDVRAAQERERQASALATLGAERSKPTFEVFGSYALNGQKVTLNDALSNSFSNSIPTRVIGLKMAIPLDLGSASDARAGYRKEQVAADLNARRKLYEQDREWLDLSLSVTLAKRRYTLGRAIESAQVR